MDEGKLISVIIPAYNAGKYIAETIQSVIDQSYRYWELIIVDDGSTDNTAEVIKPFLTDKRIKYFLQKNSGVSATRNKGASQAKGDYFAFLDADDLWHETYLEKKLHFLEYHASFDMVVSNIQVINEKSEKQIRFFLGVAENALEKIIEFRDNYSALPSNIFCRKSAYFQTKGFDTALSNSADKMFYVDFLMQSSIASINEILVLYRIHPKNMHQNINLMISDFLIFKNILDSKNVYKDNVQKKLCQTLIYKICAGGYLEKRKYLGSLVYLFKILTIDPVFLLKEIINIKKIRKFIFAFLYKLGIGEVLMKRNRASSKIPILLFHRITPETDYMYPPIAPRDFESIIRFLSKKYQFTGIESLFTKTAEELKNTCIIVFDDGFEDFYQYACLVIKKYNIPVTVFLPSDNIMRQQVIWTSQLDNSISNSEKKEIKIQFKEKKLSFSLRTAKQKIDAAKRIREFLLSLPFTDAEQLFETIKKTLNYDPKKDATLMNLNQVKELRTYVDIDIESHSMSHQYLPSLDDEQLDKELRESKYALENIKGKPVTYLSYPVGGYDNRVMKAAKKYYTASFAVDNACVDLKKIKDENYLQKIPRYNIHYSNPYEVFFRINGFHSLFGR